MSPEQIILIIGAIATPVLAIWNSFQGMRIKELELKYNALCDNCVYDYTPKNKENTTPN